MRLVVFSLLVRALVFRSDAEQGFRHLTFAFLASPSSPLFFFFLISPIQRLVSDFHFGYGVVFLLVTRARGVGAWGVEPLDTPHHPPTIRASQRSAVWSLDDLSSLDRCHEDSDFSDWDGLSPDEERNREGTGWTDGRPGRI